MAPKRARFYTYGDDTRCSEIKKYIEDAGILLDVRDLSKNPLSRYELSDLVGHLNIDHFLNPMSESFVKHNLDEHQLKREELIELMAQDYTLIRRPIIVSSRLITIGCDKKKIAEMLQINSNGQVEQTIPDNRGNRRMAAGANR